MNLQKLNLGTGANTSTGDTLRDGGFKINDNFVELFTYGPARHRQSVVLYKTLSGSPAFLEYEGLNVDLIAPIFATIGAGIETRGERNAPLVITGDVLSAWTVTNNASSYLYIQKDSLTATPVYGFSNLAPYKAQTSATSPTSGQHWFDTLHNQMYQYNGTDFEAVNRVFVAMVVATGGAITTLDYYTETEESDYVDSSVSAASANLHSFTVSRVSTATAYTDTKVASVTAYTDTQILSALRLSAYPYSDSALVSANNYTDLQISSVYLSAQRYADNSAKKYALIFG